MTLDIRLLNEIIQEVKRLAKAYYALTGRPLGVTGEIAEYEAARLLGLRLSEVRQAGYDATYVEDNQVIRVQIKGRCILENAKPGQRVGNIKLNHEWDSVILVLLDKNFEPTNLYIANRSKIEEALLAPGSKARNERGSLSVEKFKSISRHIWSSSELQQNVL